MICAWLWSKTLELFQEEFVHRGMLVITLAECARYACPLICPVGITMGQTGVDIKEILQVIFVAMPR